jgi:hypothetical protein
MITVISPRISNLGDFSHCLPALSGLYKSTGHKISFVICDRLQRFRGIKELFLAQEMFAEVSFLHEQKFNHEKYILIDDQGHEGDCVGSCIITHRYANFIKQNYKIDFNVDESFELYVPKFDIDYHQDKIIIGDRWSPKDAYDVDDRRSSYAIHSSGKIAENCSFYLDYTKDLLHNCSLIKYNKNLFVSTFTGISILADLMTKEQIVLWSDDLINWDNKPITHSFELHYFQNRKSRLQYLGDFTQDKIYEHT